MSIPSYNEAYLNQTSGVFWLTGLSGAGKTSLAKAVVQKIQSCGYLVTRLDGDVVRKSLSNNLGFSLADRQENIRRVAEAAKLILNTGAICLSSFISPTQEIRGLAKEIIGTEKYKEIYVKASIETCIKRDPKGLYAKALRGEIRDFTGVDAEYQIPENPDFIVDTEKYSLDECIEQLLAFILKFQKI